MSRTLPLLLVILLSACIPFGDAWLSFGGLVRDTNGDPLDGVVLRIAVNGEERAVTQSAPDGAYKFFDRSCPCDFSFVLTAEKEGYRSYVFTARGRDANRLSEHNIILTRGG